MTHDWSAALGASPASPDWKSGAVMSLLAAHLGIRFRELFEAFDDVTIER